MLIDQGTVDALAWSPDGKRLAFVSHRGGHSIVGVYDFDDRTIVWLSPSFDDDSSPAFSPDCTQVAFVRVPAQKTPPAFYSQRSGRQWSIWTADVKAGQGRRVWIADAGPRSIFRPTRSPTNDVLMKALEDRARLIMRHMSHPKIVSCYCRSKEILGLPPNFPPGERQANRLRFTGVGIGAMDVASLKAGLNLPPAVVKSLFQHAMTIRVGLAGFAQFLQSGAFGIGLRLMGD